MSDKNEIDRLETANKELLAEIAELRNKTASSIGKKGGSIKSSAKTKSNQKYKGGGRKLKSSPICPHCKKGYNTKEYDAAVFSEKYREFVHARCEKDVTK